MLLVMESNGSAQPINSAPSAVCWVPTGVVPILEKCTSIVFPKIARYYELYTSSNLPFLMEGFVHQLKYTAGDQ